MNPGTEGGGMKTVIGDRLRVPRQLARRPRLQRRQQRHLLQQRHAGRPCARSGDFAIIGGGAAVIQFARVGAHSFIGGMSGLENDLIPYGMALGNRAHLSGLNIIGLQRRGFSREDIHSLRRAYRLLFADEGTLVERLDDVEKEFADHPIVKEIVAFIRVGGKRSLCMPHPDRERSPASAGTAHALSRPPVRCDLPACAAAASASWRAEGGCR